jgi:hypothetical protein
MTTIIHQVMTFNMIIAFIVMLGLVSFVFLFTPYIDDKPKSNKIRKWWNKHIMDLDNKYN